MEGAGKRKRADVGSPPMPSSTGTQPEGKRSRRERRPSARFLERDVGNRGAFQRGGKRASKKPNASPKNTSTTVGDLTHRENDASSTKSKVVSPKVIEYITISDDEDVPPPTQRTPQAPTSQTQIECIEIEDSDAEGSSYPLSPTSAPMTPGNMSNRDAPFSARSEEQQLRPADADATPCPAPSGATTTAAGPSTSSSCNPPNTVPPRFSKYAADALAANIVDEQPSQFLRDVQSFINKRRSQNPSRQLAIRVQYHDFSSRTAHPPPLFQSWVDKLIKKSGS